MPDTKLMDERLARLEEAIADLKEIVERGNRDIHEVKQAVMGDSKIGLSGLVKDNDNMKRWRANVDLRVAGIAGGVTVIGFIFTLVIKYLFHV